MTPRLVLERLLVGLALIGIWQALTAIYGATWFSSPGRVALRILAWLANGELERNAWATLQAALLGFVLGAVPGALLPIALRRLPVLAAVLDPFFVAGYAVPKLALTPLLVVWFGIGIWSKVALVGSLSFFLVLFQVQAGVRGIDPKLIRMAEVLGATETQVARRIVWPATMPFLLAGLRVALPFAIGGTAVAEMVSANRGLGYLIQAASMSFDPTGSFTAIVTLTALVAAANLLVGRIERGLLAWRPRAPGAA